MQRFQDEVCGYGPSDTLAWSSDTRIWCSDTLPLKVWNRTVDELQHRIQELEGELVSEQAERQRTMQEAVDETSRHPIGHPYMII